MGLTAALSACMVSLEGLCALRSRRPAAATEGRAATDGLAMVRDPARLLDIISTICDLWLGLDRIWTQYNHTGDRQSHGWPEVEQRIADQRAGKPGRASLPAPRPTPDRLYLAHGTLCEAVRTHSRSRMQSVVNSRSL